ncbi:MAG: Zn-ribbon domain-containing OB-fold protein [Chloroflexota bacterium]
MEVSRHWRLQSQRYNLVGETCPKCGVKLFPPRDVCLECESPAHELFTFSGRGEVYSYTTVYDPPAGFETYGPYQVALIKLQEGPLVTAQLTDVDTRDVHIGLPVEMVTRKLRTDGPEGVIVYGYKFRPSVATPVPHVAPVRAAERVAVPVA